MLLIKNQHLVFALTHVVVLALVTSCQASDDGPTPSDPVDAAVEEVGPDVAEDAPTAEVTPDASPADVHEASPLPDGAPPGWQAWTEWSDDCPLYVPGPNAEMPAPIEWEPCSVSVPSSLGCRRMKDTWSGASLGISGYPNFTLDPATGKALLQFTRIRVGGNKEISFRLVAEADGVVRNAILKLDTSSNDCGFLEEEVSGTRFAQGIHTRTKGSDGVVQDQWGFLGGNIDDLAPSVVFRPDDPTEASAWFISDRWVIRLVAGKHLAYDWTFQQRHTVYDAAGDLPPFDATVVGEDVFSEVSTSNYCGVLSWNLEHGSRPLLRWYGDSTHGAGNFDTDGKDMVWTYSAGPKGCGVDASNPEVWTAPYTTDPAVLQATARRVRKDVFGMSAYPYAVGFGYAMRTDDSSNLFVVRLSDGRASFLPSVPGLLSWNGVLGVADGELFVKAHMKEDTAGLTIARIPIANLPFDLPAD